MKLNVLSLLLILTPVIGASNDAIEFDDTEEQDVFRSLRRHLRFKKAYSQIMSLDFLDYAPGVTDRLNVSEPISEQTLNTTKACIKIKDANATEGQGLILSDCTANEIGPGEGWRMDQNNLLRSQENDDLCIQAGRDRYPDDGRILRLFPCNTSIESQKWVHKKRGDGDYSLRSYYYRSFCVVWLGVTPQLGEDDVLLNRCKEVRGRRRWDIVILDTTVEEDGDMNDTDPDMEGNEPTTTTVLKQP